MRHNTDRPLSRGLIKLAFRILLGEQRAHYQDWFPWLCLDPPQPLGDGKIRYKGQLIAPLMRSIDVLDPNLASELIVIGSGPSVSDARIDRIGPKTAILLNGALTLCSSHGLDPLAVVIEDERFVWRHFAIMKEAVGPQTVILMSPSVIRALCELDVDWLKGRRIVLIDNLRKPYLLQKRRDIEIATLPHVRMSHYGAGLSLIPDQGVLQGGSVAVTALQFALFWHPKKISFLGVDINNANMPRFYEESDRQAYSGILAAKQRILDHFKLGAMIAEERGIKLVTYSRHSALRDINIPFSDELFNF